MLSANLPSETELFRKIAVGDEIAFAAVFHRFRSALYHFSLKITKSEDAAEEMVQECFMKLWTNRQALAEVENPVAYIYVIARNSSLDYMRRLSMDENMRVKVKVRTIAAANPTVEHLNLMETRQIVDEAIAQLPASQKKVFELSRMQGKSYLEIAAELNLSPNTVRNHMVRALRFIREYLENRYNGSLSVLLLLHLAANGIRLMETWME